MMKRPMVSVFRAIPDGQAPGPDDPWGWDSLLVFSLKLKGRISNDFPSREACVAFVEKLHGKVDWSDRYPNDGYYGPSYTEEEWYERTCRLSWGDFWVDKIHGEGTP